MSGVSFTIEKKIPDRLGRAGLITTEHGDIQTPCFIPVATKATVKAISPAQLREMNVEAILSNTYHLYLEPGHSIIEQAGGVQKFSGWNGPMFTDSGGFQAFSLGAAFTKGISKIIKEPKEEPEALQEEPALANIDEDGVWFKSFKDGSEHRFTPEISIQIQHSIGADIIFAFDECTSPNASDQYQRQAMERTHAWAKRSLDEHKKNPRHQGLFGIVQGGRVKELREESAKFIGDLDFDGFGIGGSFDKEDIGTSVQWVNSILPEGKPRHLLGIGEPADLFDGVAAGCDTFDCVAPTRNARNGSIYTKYGRINIMNTKFRNDFEPIEQGCACYTCQNFTKAYVAHLFHAKEILASTLASIHNVYFIHTLVKKIRQSILDDNFELYRNNFFSTYDSKTQNNLL